MSVQSLSLTKAGGIRVALLVFAVFVCVLAFGRALMDLLARWTWYGEEYSHGILIPIVTAWLLWSRRHALATSFGPPAWAGLILVLLAMAMYVTGELSAIYILAQIGFIVALLGIVLGIGGYPLFKMTFVPIAFLIFAIPPPNFIQALLTFKLQLVSSELGTWFISMFQIRSTSRGTSSISATANWKLRRRAADCATCSPSSALDFSLRIYSKRLCGSE